MAERLELDDGRWHVAVAPALGGSLIACEYDGVAVMTPVPQPAGGGRPAFDGCHLPLVPYSNRVADSRFDVDGRTIRLAPNVEGSPHAMHGHGWQAAWQVLERARHRCTLVLHRDATPDWPWAYRTWQYVALQDGALHLTLGLENRGPGAMPCGLGFHPFLARRPDTCLAFEAAQVGNRSAADIPTEDVAVPPALDFRDGPRLAAREGTNHCYAGWQGRAVIRGDASAGFDLDGCAATRHLIIYVPTGADYYCVEPVTHAVDAMNRPDPAAAGLWRLAPRARREISLTITPRDSWPRPRRTSGPSP